MKTPCEHETFSRSVIWRAASVPCRKEPIGR